VNSLDRPVAGRTVLEFLSRLVDVDAIEVVARVSNRATGKSIDLRVTTPPLSWSLSTSKMRETQG
jgi:hypothetical protein